MSYEIIALDEFQKEARTLFKKYKSIKSDILGLIEILENRHDAGIELGNNLYKIRVKNSDIGGKSGGYRVIYYAVLPNNTLYLLTIYSKTQQENIDIKKLNPILDKIHKQ
jgi:mRNA-degrading endonuclease RelE of RelBE toxin-antitoxin system